MTRDETNRMIAKYMGTTELVKYYHDNDMNTIMAVVQKLARELRGRPQLRILSHVVLYGSPFNIFEVCGSIIEFQIINKEAMEQLP